MILVLNLDLDVMMNYLHAKMGSIGQMVQMLWLRNIGKLVLFDSFDLDFDPMTLILNLDLNIMVTLVLKLDLDMVGT